MPDCLFILPWRQAPISFWRCLPACPFFSNPFFLEKKKWVRGSRKRTQRKPFEKVSSELFRKQRGRGPFETPGLHHLSPAKIFAEQKCFAAVGSIDLLLGIKIAVIQPNRHGVKMRKRVLTILVSTLILWVQRIYNPGESEGPQPLCLWRGCKGNHTTVPLAQLLPGGSTR